MESTLSRSTASGAGVDARLARLEAILDKAPDLLASVTDTIDELSARLAETGAPIDQRADGLAVLAEQLTRPETSTAAARIASRLDALEGSIAALAELPAVIASMTDIVDELAGRLSREGVALDQLGSRVQAAARATAHVLGSDDLSEGPEKVGIFGLLKAMRDPDVQRAMALAMRLARAVGKTIDSENSTKELARG